MQEIKQYSWINWVKMLCMFCVYLYHTKHYLNNDDFGIYTIYISFFTKAFFFVSGYLLFAKQLSSPIINQTCIEYVKANGGGNILAKNIINKLILPTLLFTSLNYFPKRLLREQGIDYFTFLHDTFLGGSIWFTSALTVAEILILLSLLFRVKNIYLYIALSVMFVYISAILVQYNIIFFNDQALPWYYKGGFCFNIRWIVLEI